MGGGESPCHQFDTKTTAQLPLPPHHCKLPTPMAYRGGRGGRFAPGRHSEGAAKKRKKKKRKKEKKEKRKKEKKRKRKYRGEACNFTKTINWSILAAALLCTYNLTFGAPIHFGTDAWLLVRLVIRYTCTCIGRQHV